MPCELRNQAVLCTDWMVGRSGILNVENTNVTTEKFSHLFFQLSKVTKVTREFYRLICFAQLEREKMCPISSRDHEFPDLSKML